MVEDKIEKLQPKSRRDKFTKKMTTNYKGSFYKMAFSVKKSNKLTANMRSILSTILDILKTLDHTTRFIFCSKIPNHTPLTSTIEEEKMIKEPLKFLNHL